MKKKWLKFKIGPLPAAIPNTSSMLRAVRVHDLNHVITGYDTNLTGEATISAFEIGAGCGDYAAAWMINLWGFTYGVFLAPRGLLHAFVRGHRSGSLYRCAIDDDTLDRTVGALRREVRLHPEEVESTVREWVAFLAWLGIGWLWSLACLAVFVVPLVGLLTWLL